MAKVAAQTYLPEFPVRDLKLHPENANKGDVDLIAESIEENDFYGAIVVQKSTGYVLAGNHRYLAGAKAGLDALPVFLLDVSNAAARKIVLVDNRSRDNSAYDDKKLAALLEKVRNEGDGFKGTGFVEGDLDKLIKKMGDEAGADGGGLGDEGDDDAPGVVIQYAIIFDDQRQQETWFELIRRLKKAYPSEGTVAARVTRYIEAHPLDGV